MKHVSVAVLLLALSLPLFAKTHQDTYNVPCSQLWLAVKDVLRNSGKYGIIGIDNNEMTASYNIGGGLAGKRINSVVLNSRGGSCELQTQTAYSGLIHNDAGDFKKRIEESLVKVREAQSNPPKASQEAEKSAPPLAPQPAATPIN